MFHFSACGTRSSILCYIFPHLEGALVLCVVFFLMCKALWYLVLYFSACGMCSDILCCIFPHVEFALVFFVIYFSGFSLYFVLYYTYLAFLLFLFFRLFETMFDLCNLVLWNFVLYFYV